MRVDYNYYSNVYKGKVREEDFTSLEIKASGILNYYTFNRIEEVTENIKLAICELIDYIAEEERIRNEKEIQSESVGTHSVTYAIAKNRNKNSSVVKKEQKDIIYKYLAHTNLLYRGV